MPQIPPSEHERHERDFTYRPDASQQTTYSPTTTTTLTRSFDTPANVIQAFGHGEHEIGQIHGEVDGQANLRQVDRV